MDEKALRHIHKQAELCKLGFADGRKSTMNCKVGEELFSFTVDLTQYEAACEELLDKINDWLE